MIAIEIFQAESAIKKCDEKRKLCTENVDTRALPETTCLGTLDPDPVSLAVLPDLLFGDAIANRKRECLIAGDRRPDTGALECLCDLIRVHAPAPVFPIQKLLGSTKNLLDSAHPIFSNESRAHQLPAG